MPVVDKPQGVVTPRRIGEPLTLGISAAKDEFGFGVNNPANTIREIVEAVGALPWDAREQDILDLSIQFDPRLSVGQFLEAGLWPLVTRQAPTKAGGVVNFNYNQIVTAPTPLFAAGDLEFVDGAGLRYTGTSDLNPPAAIHDTSAQTGTWSETIGSGTTKIAQRVRILDTDFPQAIRIRTDVISSVPVIEARIESESGGVPGGVLANARLVKTPVTVVDVGNTDIIIPKGAIVETGFYWIVLTVSAGTAAFDGGTGGTADQVKVWNGAAWVNSTTIENMNLKLLNGGEFSVAAVQLGEAGNVEAGGIGAVRANNGAAQTRFDTIVDSFENLKAFEGGRDLETDEEFRARARTQSAARGTSSPGGIVTGLLDGDVAGVTFVDIKENDSLTWGTEETVLDNSSKTGTQADLIDGVTYTRIAQKFIVDGYGSVSAWALKLAVDTGGVMTIGIYADSAGSPAAALYSAKLERTGVTPAGTARYLVTLPDGDFLAPGTYWFAATRTAGSFRFDGSNAGVSNNVKRHTGAAWENSTVVKDINIEIFGGVPGKSFQVFVEGGSDDDVAQGIYDLRAPGIRPYGAVRGNALDAAGRTVTQDFSRPVNVDIVLDVEVQTTPAFAGTAADIKDLITEYVAELGIGDTFVVSEARSRLMTGDSRTVGVFDILKFRVGRKTSFATPAALTSAEVINLLNTYGKRFRIFAPSTDIAVTVTPVT